MNARRFMPLACLMAAIVCSVLAHAQTPFYSVSITGTEQMVNGCGITTCGPTWDGGQVGITVNGSNTYVGYGQGSTDSSVASALCSAIGTAGATKCTSVSGGALTVTSSSNVTAYNWHPSQLSGTGSIKCLVAVGVVSGYINPKYVILGVTYAPPGPQSFVQYQNSTTVGSSTSLTGSFANDVGLSVAVSSTTGAKGTIPDIGGTYGWSDTTTNTFSQDFTVEEDTSSSVAISSVESWTTKVPGPASAYVGVDHDYDVIWLWLNPLLNFTMPTNAPHSITWTGYNFDADDVHEMEIYGVYLGWLTGRLTTPGPGSSDLTPLQRTWAGLPSNGQVWPAGTSSSIVNATDYAAIAAADPFSNASYTVTVPSTPAGNLTSSDGRFTLTGNQTIDYVQPPPGGQPFTQQLSESTTLTQTQGEGVKYTLKVEYSWEDKFTASFLEDSWSTDIKTSNALTFTNGWSKSNNEGTGVTAVGSVTGPPCVVSGSTCNPIYNGPTEYEVFKDNIYGTYMFYPVN